MTYTMYIVRNVRRLTHTNHQATFHFKYIFIHRLGSNVDTCFGIFDVAICLQEK